MAKSIIVSQIGARHRYLIPQLLDNHKILYRLYTDSNVNSFLGKVAQCLLYLGVSSRMMSRLVNRKPSISSKKIFSSDRILYQSILYRLCHKSKYDQMLLVYDGCSKNCIQWGVDGADCVYGMYFENFEFLKYAKSQGLKVVVDIYERPMTYKLLAEEIRNTPEFSIFQDDIPKYELKHKVRMHYIEELLKIADYYTVPSKFVIKSLEQYTNYDSKKVLFLPYPSSIISAEYKWKPVKYRILFVGSDPVNKGLLYCALAATKLKSIFPDIDFRVAGGGFEKVKTLETFKDLNFIGFLNHDMLMKEYQTAEVFVFPTLFEGFAGAVIEAASCGCPIITTRNSGVDPDTFPGIIIPEKDTDAIVDSVKRIILNKEYQNNLSFKIYEYGKSLHPIKYEQSLVKIFETI